MAEGEPKLNDASGQIGLHDEADQKRAEPPVGETAEADRAADSSRQSGLSADEQESRQQPAAKEAEGGERADSPPAELPAKPVRPTGMEPPRTRIRLSDEEEQEIEAALAELDELAATARRQSLMWSGPLSRASDVVAKSSLFMAMIFSCSSRARAKACCRSISSRTRSGPSSARRSMW